MTYIKTDAFLGDIFCRVTSHVVYARPMARTRHSDVLPPPRAQWRYSANPTRKAEQMPKSPGTRPELDLILDIFPEDASLIRRLFLSDQSFRSACEDYAVARRLRGLALRVP